MVAIQRTTSLNLVKEELDATLRQAETGLEAYVENPANPAALNPCIEAFHQVWGVLKVLEVPGAAELAQELESTARHVQQADVKEPQLAALGNGIMVLGRYTEFLQIKGRNLPQLLVPALNALRATTGKQPVPESAFFPCDINGRRPGEGSDALESDAEIARLTRRLRQMYQVGLLGVLRGDNVATNLKMMDRALERVDKLGGGTPAGRLWWTARGALRALGQRGIEIDRTRKLYLGGIDRHLKQVVAEGGRVLREDPPKVLLRESIYLASLLPTSDQLGAAIRKAFRVSPDAPTAAQLVEEREVMSGPGGSVIRTVAAQVHADLTTVKDLLDATMRGGSDAGYAQAAEEMAKVAHTLVMLGLTRESQVLKARAEVVRSWDGQNIDPGSADFQRLIDEMLAVENNVATLEKRFTPGETALEGETKGSLYQLDDARKVVIAECRSGIALAKRGLTSYIEANFDRAHLNNIPKTLKDVSGGLRFLNLERAVGVLDACMTYIESRLLNANLPSPGANDMETLADAITSVDYFIESIEQLKPIGDGVLEIAEMSMEELGTPVAKRRPAR
ncbi:MAG: hypothetical protein ACOY33_05120 [Pseudomonadota bacterium]